MDIIGWVFAAPIITLGLFTAITGWRFVRSNKGIVDQSAGFLAFLFVIWLMMTQKEKVAKAFPFVAMDLSEMIQWRKDDKIVT